MSQKCRWFAGPTVASNSIGLPCVRCETMRSDISYNQILIAASSRLCLICGVSQQQTLRQGVSFSGVGLHSGNRVSMTFLPAPPNTGIRFRRVDLDGKPEIEARVENVSQTTRSTTLAKGNAKIQTVEHVLATLTGYEVDNAIVELDSN